MKDGGRQPEALRNAAGRHLTHWRYFRHAAHRRQDDL